MSPNLDYNRLRRWKDKHKGDSCILICNGPSLKSVEFSQIDTNKYVLFGLNKIFLGFEQFEISPKYIVAVNQKVLEQCADVYRHLRTVKFVSNRVDTTTISLVHPDPFTYVMNTRDLPDNPERFSKDICKYVREGWTVTHVALQLIYYMGFREVNIIGMDHRFQQFVAGRENQASVIEGEDRDHFHPEYFGYGQEWDLPDIAESEISYAAALQAFQNDGRSIFDCTTGGACTVFPKREVASLYGLES